MSCPDTIRITPLILSGGSGTRLWPLSVPERPKQFHNFGEPLDLFERTLQRLSGPEFSAPIVVSNDSHRNLVAAGLDRANIAPASLVLEPVGRNTAPAITAAVLPFIERNPETVFLVSAADSHIIDRSAYVETVKRALPAALDGKIVTIGIKPSHPETGFGYIRKGDALPGIAGVWQIDAFVEKPDLETAKTYVESGDYMWNSGMFMFSGATYRSELERQRPDILEGCADALRRSLTEGSTTVLDRDSFGAIDNISIDYAVMEGCATAAVTDAAFDWNDIGSWQALWEVMPKDADGNVLIGRTTTLDTTGSLVYADDDRTVAVLGCDDLVVVVSGNRTLVLPKSRSQDVKRLLEELDRT